jgi:threonine dehydrogenase-like Zn-dependent dehydrogenase
VIDRVVEVARRGPAPVDVIGDSDLARQLRDVLGSATAPGTVVETTGTAAGLQEAIERVADLGTIVLAGPVPPTSISLDLHDGVHVRGLTLIGIRPSTTG